MLLAVVAEEALPDRVAVIVPAEKLPDPSLVTIAFIVFADVAVVAELGIEFREAPEPEKTEAVTVPGKDVFPDASKIVAVLNRVVNTPEYCLKCIGSVPSSAVANSTNPELEAVPLTLILK